jgi:hypothetical protein
MQNKLQDHTEVGPNTAYTLTSLQVHINKHFKNSIIRYLFPTVTDSLQKYNVGNFLWCVFDTEDNSGFRHSSSCHTHA